ncbi:MAG: DHH family phosphoesterase [Tannerella sp.]|jgi:phosphoesterase RecJ-like protein|nr:DHH family phosphoesterase [Tannerella sp.]
MLTKIFSEKEVQRFQSYVDKGERFVIVTHISPDGDALGASLALYHYLTNQGNRADLIVPNDFPVFLGWLPGAKDIVVYERYADYAEQLIREADVICCLDFNEPKRIGKMASHVEAADADKVMVDHHLNPANFCDLIISYPDMSSTSEMIFRLLCRMKAFDDINRDIAECIYTGMMTDTGGFTYHSNNADLYLIIMELVRKGIDKDAIYRRVYQVYSESRLRLMGYVLCEKMKIYPDCRTAMITLTLKELNRFKYATGDTEGFVNLPLSIEGIRFAVLIREDTDFVKLSLRSVGDFPCNRFAATCFNGGGHLNASGGEFYGTLTDAVAAFERGLKKFNPEKYPASE